MPEQLSERAIALGRWRRGLRNGLRGRRGAGAGARDDGRNKIFVTETFADAAVSGGADAAHWACLLCVSGMAGTPPGYFAGKVRTDKDLSTKLS